MAGPSWATVSVATLPAVAVPVPLPVVVQYATATPPPMRTAAVAVAPMARIFFERLGVELMPAPLPGCCAPAVCPARGCAV